MAPAPSGNFRYRWLRLTFDNSNQVSIHPAHSDREVVSEADYDWSAVDEGHWLKGGDPVEFIRGVHERWSRTGLAPYPGVYEVRTSEAPQLKREYVVVGHDSYVRIRAEGISWQVLIDLPDW
jgi:hypothetical protein